MPMSEDGSNTFEGGYVSIPLGAQFGSRIVIADAGFYESLENGKKRRRKIWLVRCMLYNSERSVWGSALRREGGPKNCGCLSRARIREDFTTFIANGGTRDAVTGKYTNSRHAAQEKAA